jgi:hypothetical protein
LMTVNPRREIRAQKKGKRLLGQSVWCNYARLAKRIRGTTGRHAQMDATPE